MIKVLKLIGTVHKNQTECLRSILELYSPSMTIDMDITFGAGGLYRNLGILPDFCSDLNPRYPHVHKYDARNLPAVDSSESFIVFDPPFLLDSSKSPAHTSIMSKKYGSFPYYRDFIYFCRDVMIEVHRVLVSRGILVIKCQDQVDGCKNYFSHVDLIHEAEKNGFRCKDIFILVNKNRLLNLGTQEHARKEHSYFLVLKKVARVRENKNHYSRY
ncbi:hypothetical protein ES703_65438 [subsurface metagenome]